MEQKENKIAKDYFTEEQIMIGYLSGKGLDYERFITRFYPQVQNVQTAKRKVDNIDIWKLIEILSSQNGKFNLKTDGVVFTPHFIANYINTQVINQNVSSDIKVIDPACGNGVFLIDALLKLKQNTNKSCREIVEENIWGIDINPEAVRRTKILLSLITYELEGEIPDKFNLYVGNSLDKNFWQTFLGNLKFEAVVGNPPYVRIQNLGEEMRETIKKYWKLAQGDMDLFIPFIELGLEILAENGRMGYITPNSYFTSYAGKLLREFLQSNKYIEEIIDFNHYQVFKGVTTYTAITIFSKKARDFFIFKKVKSPTDFANFDKIAGNKVYYQNLNPEKWILATDSEKNFSILVKNSQYRLKDVADVRVGLATLANSVYILEKPEEIGNYFVKCFNGKDYLIEKEITQEIIKASVIKTEIDIAENKNRIIFPYEKVGERYVIISEDKLRYKFPQAYNYLLACRHILDKRDKGKRKYETWYAYGRTQGINTSFGEKILTPLLAQKPTFVVCEKENSTFYNGYGIFPHTEPFTDLYLLKKILNSKVMEIYIETASKSYRNSWKAYAKSFIQDFGLPNLTSEQIEILKSIEEQETLNEFLLRIYGLK